MPTAGTQEFSKFLSKQTFLSPKNQIEIMRGCDINGHFFEQNGFDKPVLVPEIDGLRIKVPHPSFRLPDVVQYTNPETLIEVIDVEQQSNSRMRLGDYVRVFLSEQRSAVLNVLSLEFSHTELSKLVQPPHVVSELSLVESCWPDNDEDEKPYVQKYCLMSMAGSYTDFHIDFGGSSVWYHILWGEKIFYLIPPTRENLRQFWRWHSIPDNRDIFFPDMLERSCLLRTDSGDTLDVPPVYRLCIKAGQTVLLPAGWIHAVYTSCDSLVFGGNFLTSLHVPIQLEVYAQEKHTETEERFLFPYFEKLHWFFADSLLGKFCIALEHKTSVQVHELGAAHALLQTLPTWLKQHKDLPDEQKCLYLPPSKEMESRGIANLLQKLPIAYRTLVSRNAINSASSSLVKTLNAPLPSPKEPVAKQSRKQKLQVQPDVEIDPPQQTKMEEQKPMVKKPVRGKEARSEGGYEAEGEEEEAFTAEGEETTAFHIFRVRCVCWGCAVGQSEEAESKIF
ncbi:Lysine-specific demethylase 7A [Cichlidogyrus casuarinus]|uniref:Lysine-specific demethylase 7A n=1 Tax=Cichlidogyrus casuarinus TaxID=1844966 RepID=A0ABD2Q9T4_9PLAT